MRKSVAGFVAVGIISLVDLLSGEAISSVVFSLLPESQRPYVLHGALFLGWTYFVFCFGKDWHRRSTPIAVFRRFLNEKIAQGEKLFRTDLPDQASVKNSKGVLDHETVAREFARKYSQWRRDVFGALSLMIRNLSDHSILDPLSHPNLPPPAVLYGGFRRYLREDLTALTDLRVKVRPGWLKEGCDSDDLSEYE